MLNLARLFSESQYGVHLSDSCLLFHNRYHHMDLITGILELWSSLGFACP